VPSLTEPVRARILTEPRHYSPFLLFCCGKDRKSELEVSEILHHIWAGTSDKQSLVVILELQRTTDVSENPALLGYCAITTRPLGQLGAAGVPGLTEDELGAYILGYGTDLAYRKHTLKDGKTSIGASLLKAALKAIKLAFGDGEMPFVKAMVLPDNAPSQLVLDEHCFESLGLGPFKQQLHVVRLPGVALGKTRKPTWAPFQQEP
jgi:hypothetical protein